MKILVADDDVLIQEYIVQCIQSAGEEYKVIGTATTGIKALNIVSREQPDLVLADITMPKMDGLELLRHLKAEYPAIQVIMLTCHNDFTNVRTAMHLQANAYILKNEISPEMLKKLLQETVEKCRAAAPESKITDQIRRNNYLRRVMDNEDAVFVIRDEDLQQHKIMIKNYDFIAVSFQNTEHNIDMVMHYHAGNFENYLLYPYHELTMVLFCNLKSFPDEKQKEIYVQQYLAALETSMDGQLGCSRIYYRVAGLKQALYEAVADMDRKFYKQNQASTDAVISRSDARVQLQKRSNQAIAYLSEHNIVGYCDTLIELCRFAKTLKPNVTYLKNTLLSLLQAYTESDAPEAPVLFEDIRGVATFDALNELLMIYADSVREQCKTYSAAIAEAVAYIRCEYAQNITLSMVAEHVYLNSEYLSRQFKKEVGKGFSEYLTQIRMKRAQLLLRTTNMKTSDIAFEVGFPNASHFANVFRKEFGITPLEMRKQSR